MTMESQLNWLMKSLEYFPLPKPIASFAGKTGGNLGKGNATSYQQLRLIWEIVH